MSIEAAPRTWTCVHFDLDDTCFGYVLRDDDGVVYAYERRSGGDGPRLRVPCFARREHAQLFAAQWPDRPTLHDGPSYDLGALRDAHARGGDTADAEHAWALVIDVLDAIDDGDGFEFPEEGLVDPDQLRDGLARFVAAIDPLDRAP